MTRFSLIALAFLVVIAPAGAQTKDDWRALPRVLMQEEDSHPHEVFPGRVAWFHTDRVETPSLMRVKCSIEGPAAQAEIVTFGMELKNWPLKSKVFDITPGKTLWFDIDAVVRPTPRRDPYFAFRNLDAYELLWHQCYNN